MTERKHKRVKSTGTWIFNQYEHTLIRTLLYKQVSALGASHMCVAESLVGPRVGDVGSVQLSCASAARLVSGEVRKGDYVAIAGRRLGHVLSFIEMDGSVFTRAKMLMRTTSATVWAQTEIEQFIPSAEVVKAVMYASSGEGGVRIIAPADQ